MFNEESLATEGNLADKKKGKEFPIRLLMNQAERTTSETDNKASVSTTLKTTFTSHNKQKSNSLNVSIRSVQPQHYKEKNDSKGNDFLKYSIYIAGFY